MKPKTKKPPIKAEEPKTATPAVFDITVKVPHAVYENRVPARLAQVAKRFKAEREGGGVWLTTKPLQYDHVYFVPKETRVKFVSAVRKLKFKVVVNGPAEKAT
jgi:hypothetical protein